MKKKGMFLIILVLIFTIGIVCLSSYYNQKHEKQRANIIYNVFKEKDKENEETEITTETQTNDNDDRELIKTDNHKLSEGKLSISLSKDNNNQAYFTVTYISDKSWLSAYIYTILSSICSTDEFEKLNPTVMVVCDEVCLTSLFSYTQTEPVEIIDSGEWCAEQFLSDEFDIKKAQLISDEVEQKLLDFFKTPF